MMKGKKLIVFLMAVCMMISMSFGMVAEAATTAASTQEQAELMAGKAYTIKKGKSGKWFYQNSRGKTDKKQGWKKDKSGKYAYYVGSKGYVTAKVTGGVYYKWSDKKWKKQTLKKNSTKTICGKAFYVNENGKISKTTGWMKVSGKYAYYVNGNGAVSVKITKGVYQKWSKTGWKKQKLDNYVGGIITIQKKAFFVGSDKKIIRKCGWNKFALGYSAGSSSRGYTGTEGSVLYYESTTGAYKINAKGEVPKQPMKNGWNGAVFVKNGKVQINKTVEISCYKNVFDKDGKRVVLKIEDGKIVRSDTGKAVGAGNYKVGSGNTKTTYVVDNSGQIKTSGTVKINGKTYTIGSDGKVDVQKPSNGGSGDQQDDKKNDDSGNGNSDSKQHVCKWLVVLDKNQNPVQLTQSSSGNGYEGLVQADDSGWLVTSLPYDENFHITVDGKEIQPERLNTAFLGIHIQEGKHQVKIWYESAGSQAGLLLSGVAVVVGGIGIFLRILLRTTGQRRKARQELIRKK